MQYTTWVEAVFEALGRACAASPYTGGVSLGAVADELGIGGLRDDDYARGEGPAGALITAMYDLETIGAVVFKRVNWGNQLTPEGRDVASDGVASLWPQLVGPIRLSKAEREFLERLYQASIADNEKWADLSLVDAQMIYRDLGLEATDDYQTLVQRNTFLGDLERKRVIKPATGATDRKDYRPTLTGALFMAPPPETAEPSTTVPLRRRGRPRGQSTVTKTDIERAYRALWQRPGARPLWKQVAHYLAVDERTLRKARDAYLITDESISGDPD